jgi:hypothetical protein
MADRADDDVPLRWGEGVEALALGYFFSQICYSWAQKGKNRRAIQ